MKRLSTICLTVALLFGLPLAGVHLSGEPLSPYLEFPPTTRSVPHAPFSWVAFAGLVLFLAAVTVPFLVAILDAPKPLRVYLIQRRSFPWWGWLGLLLVGVSWTLAWTRFPWFAPLQPHTFVPMWLGYITVVNGLTYMRTGRCLAIDRPVYFVALFPVSAVFWWFFEYMNRFVQNWHYLGVMEFSALEYVTFATLSFSTVLPAVLSTIECLESWPTLDRAFRDLWTVEVTHPRAWGWGGLVVSSAALAAIGLWPTYLFPLVWVAPLLVIVSLQTVFGEHTLFSGLQEGDWRAVWLPALAGLCCGFFWELWNSHSLAHWEYTVPYVHRFRIFEMPLLGYAGYLPFGMECVAVAQLVSRRREVAGQSV